jgi:hypothetical protein
MSILGAAVLAVEGDQLAHVDAPGNAEKDLSKQRFFRSGQTG